VAVQGKWCSLERLLQEPIQWLPSINYQLRFLIQEVHMNFFECCQKCKAPKRYPGCHGKCPEYKGQRKLWDEHQAAKRQARREAPPLTYAQKMAYFMSKKGSKPPQY
jgi:hypothetical protein